MSGGGARPASGVASIGTKLAVSTTSILLVAATLLFLQLSSAERDRLVSAKAVAAGMMSDMLASALSAPLDFGDQEALEAEVARLRSNRAVSYAAVWGGEKRTPLAELIPTGGVAPADARPTDVNARAETRNDRVVEVRPIVRHDGKILGVARVDVSLESENQAFVERRRTLLLLSLATAVGMAALLALIARRQIVLPLGELVDASQRLKRGEGKTRVEVRARDEIGRLGDAFNEMAIAIDDRETRLADANRRTQELLDNMRQVIVVFGSGGVIEGAGSRQAATAFGLRELSGRRVDQLLFPNAGAGDVEARAFSEWLVLAFDVDESLWDEVASLAPPEVALRVGVEVRTLSVEFRLIVRQGGGRRVMMLATDVTDQRRLEREMRTRQDDDARRAAAMGRLVAGGGYVFVRFVEGARQRLDRCAERLASVEMDPLACIDDIFRDVHTIKGEARAFDLGDLADELETLEEVLSELRNTARAVGVVVAAGKESASKGLVVARDALARGVERFVAASPIGAAALEQVTVRRTDLEAVVAAAATRTDDLGVAIAKLAARPFGESTSGLGEMVARWAMREGKQIRLEITAREGAVPNELSANLAGMLSHLVRNAIAHGIELPSEREAAGKPAIGRITVACEPGRIEGGAAGDAAENAGEGTAAGTEAAGVPNGPVITVSDDGRGIDETALRERARRQGIDEAGLSLSRLLLLPGLSTRDVDGVGSTRGAGLVGRAGVAARTEGLAGRAEGLAGRTEGPVSRAGGPVSRAEGLAGLGSGSAGADGLAGRGVGLDAVRAEAASLGYGLEIHSRVGEGTRFVLRPRSRSVTGMAAARIE